MEYQGTHYAGFQLQSGPPTIQGELEKALARFTGEHIRVRGASRTDSGAHALGQVVDFLTRTVHSTERFPPALNYYLPADIRVLVAHRVAPEFNSRRDALSRTYRYKILNRGAPSALLRQTHLWIKDQLDVQRMAEAARALPGIHNFRPVASGHPPERSAVRKVYRWEVSRQGETILIECEATGFLKQQIRRVNGILAEIGKGRQPVQLMEWVLRTGTPVPEAAPALPAHGLCLIEVKYPEPFTMAGYKLIGQG